MSIPYCSAVEPLLRSVVQVLPTAVIERAEEEEEEEVPEPAAALSSTVQEATSSVSHLPRATYSSAVTKWLPHR